MTIAQGISKQLRFKKETVWGTPAGPTGAQLLRRATSDLSLTKDTYQSAEIRSDQQVADFRHGVRSVTGNINGELSGGTYAPFFEAMLRRDFTAGVSKTGLTDVTAAATAPQFVRGTGSWLTDGFKVGDVVRCTGWTTGGVANNGKNFLITALTATDMSVVVLNGSAVAAKVSGDSVDFAVHGKKTFAPTSGHTDRSFTFEHWYSDVIQSEVFTGCKIGQMEIGLPATGMATVNSQVMGKDIVTDTAAYFTSPAPETTAGIDAAVNGALIVNGVPKETLTGLQITIAGNLTAEPVVGSNTYPAIFQGRILVTGQFTAFFEDGVERDAFINETEISLVAALTESNAADAEFIAFNLPRIKVGSASKDDGEKGLIQTFQFQALLNVAGGAGTASEKTTISVQDSLA